MRLVGYPCAWFSSDQNFLQNDSHHLSWQTPLTCLSITDIYKFPTNSCRIFWSWMYLSYFKVSCSFTGKWWVLYHWADRDLFLLYVNISNPSTSPKENCKHNNSSLSFLPHEKFINKSCLSPPSHSTLNTSASQHLLWQPLVSHLNQNNSLPTGLPPFTLYNNSVQQNFFCNAEKFYIYIVQYGCHCPRAAI